MTPVVSTTPPHGSAPQALPAGLLAATAGAAAAAGLLDIAYWETDSPIGRLLVAATPAGLVRVAFNDEGPAAVLAELAQAVSPRLLESQRHLGPVLAALERYFNGRTRDIETPLDERLIHTEYSRAVLAATAAIPSGEVRTYSEVASAAGRPKAVRAAGNALGANPICLVVPCHRVVPRGGGVGNYGGGPARKAWLLEHERRMAAG